MVKNYYLISDAAKMVEVESHVLRYWEEELQLPIKRNELGHRYYTPADIEQFKEIKELKESGMQLKAIRMTLQNGQVMPITITSAKSLSERQETKEEKSQRLIWLLQQMIADTLRDTNRELCDDIKDNIMKELDYQFRLQEERDDIREEDRMKRENEHYEKVDELIRNKSRRTFSKDKDTKRKRHSFF